MFPCLFSFLYEMREIQIQVFWKFPLSQETEGAKAETQAMDVLPGANKIKQDETPPGTGQQNGLR